MSETVSDSKDGFLGDLGRERAVILGGLMLGMLLGSIDQSIVSTALPTIVGDLGGSGSLSWIVTAYLITTAVTTPLYGKLSDLYGRSIIYEFSIAVFLIGSALSGLAGDIPVLDQHVSGMAQLAIFRAIQGIGAGGLIAMATTILGDIFSPRERGQYMSYMMLIFGASTIGGPLLGGWLTDNATWRWIFYINIPIGLAAITIIHTQLDLPVPGENHDIDYLGAVLLTIAVGSLMLVTSWGGSKYAWDSNQIYGLAAVAILGTVLFVVQELRANEPIFPVNLLTRRTVAGVDILSFCVGVGMLGGTTYLPVFLQVVLGQSATNSGLLLLPLVGGLMITSALTGQLMTRLGYYKPFTAFGAALAACGYYLLSTMGPSTTQLWSSTFMFVTGLGLGFVMPTLTVAVQNVVDHKNLGVATTSVTFSRSLGSAIGVSVFGAILTNQLSDRITDAVKSGSLSPQSAQALSGAGSNLSPEALKQLPDAAIPVVKMAVANSIDQLFLTGSVIIGFAFLVALVLPSIDLSEEANVEMGGEMGTEVPESAGTSTDGGNDVADMNDGSEIAKMNGGSDIDDMNDRSESVEIDDESKTTDMNDRSDVASTNGGMDATSAHSSSDIASTDDKSDVTNDATSLSDDEKVVDKNLDGADTENVARDIDAVRTVTPPVLQPEQTASVRLDIPNATGRFLVRETAMASTPLVVETNPRPIRTALTDGTLYTVWELDEPTDVSLTYETTVPDTLGDGDSVHFDGTLVTAADSMTINGSETIPVVDDLFERLVVQDEATNQDVTLAADLLERDDLTANQFEHIVDKWLKDQ
ncbi:MDR family MFS transporter [Haladaptatus sp. R4]|uniref:MDR family MFS transporter n=1 Tax=Haladaptatus sp. R4 TaxID=1679489 RepID=UPI000824F182|nr:MDR family MFS transporter [Haladaptatus sp. R4]